MGDEHGQTKPVPARPWELPDHAVTPKPCICGGASALLPAQSRGDSSGFIDSLMVNALNRHRRTIGVSACVYGLIHFGFHLLYEGDAQAIARSFSKPFIWFDLAGLSILCFLALTSNNVSIRKLGVRNWKRLHRLAYLAAAILIYHQAIAGKGHWHIARWLLFPLLALETARMLKVVWRHKEQSSAIVAGGVDPGRRKTRHNLKPASPMPTTTLPNLL